MSKKALYTAIKWLFVIAAFSYLAYKLISFDRYDEFLEQWRQTPASRFWWLTVVFALLPVNWLMESVKWKLLVAPVQRLSFAESLKGVLAGIATGFFTPNRIGDLVGRIAFLKPDSRIPGITLSLVSSLTQNITIMLCGIPACILFFSRERGDNHIGHYILLCVVLLLVLGVFYFSLPFLAKKLGETKLGKKIHDFIDFLSNYSLRYLLRVMLVSIVRYAVFSFQFYCMLRFFSVDLTAWQALLSIPLYYLFVTFTPSLAFSEAAVRASYAMMVIGAFSPQTVNIALAGMAIWFVNWALPLVAGSVVLLRSKN